MESTVLSEIPHHSIISECDRTSVGDKASCYDPQQSRLPASVIAHKPGAVIFFQLERCILYDGIIAVREPDILKCKYH